MSNKTNKLYGLLGLVVGIFLMFMVSVSAFDFDDGGSFNFGESTTNYSLVNVNNSVYWNGLGSPSDIDHNLLDNLEWSVSGHTIDTDFLPDTTLSYDIGSGPLRWGDLFVSDISADDISAYNIDLLGDLTSPLETLQIYLLEELI